MFTSDLMVDGKNIINKSFPQNVLKHLTLYLKISNNNEFLFWNMEIVRSCKCKQHYLADYLLIILKFISQFLSVGNLKICTWKMNTNK